MQASLRVSEELGERPNLAITHFRYAELLQQKGDLSEARENLDKAATLFREMGMTWWLEQAEALGKSLDAA